MSHTYYSIVLSVYQQSILFLNLKWLNITKPFARFRPTTTTVTTFNQSFTQLNKMSLTSSLARKRLSFTNQRSLPKRFLVTWRNRSIFSAVLSWNIFFLLSYKYPKYLMSVLMFKFTCFHCLKNKSRKIF